jgi:hypothetical protein
MEPEVPVIVTLNGPPAAAELLAVSVMTLLPDAGFTLKDAPTPLGKPLAASETLPLNPPKLATLMVLLLLLPCAADRLAGEAPRVNPGARFTVSENWAVAVSEPETPVTVTVVGPPTVALPAAVSVTTLLLVAGLGLNDALTPDGKPMAENVTLPVNPFAGVMLREFVLVLSWVSVTLALAADSEKLGAGLTVRAMVVEAVRAPEVPIMVMVTGPAAIALPEAVKARRLELVAGLAAKAAVMPAGRPEAARDTLPANPFAGVMAMPVLMLPP